ncbi:dihydroorotate dehydrogenase electron transfer subunit [Clostridium manihotivorum]|uniref:Dihydroorotate dehydrogenase B (NAD(+)), electron transfer subunit n=1 Tax=Clostridium manihotivorum TaxID=2320868 RepID=A0A3R5QWH3_9CLOT|nr:dihydroorotate dehydrogenase electron transfer subunit [Clostridium manihotivorum]QAA33886.1 dihydroorotate dehydrogenase electron transfer subunit [Clostridium manihotivorum]
MKVNYQKVKIVSNINLCSNIFKLSIQCDDSIIAGQFYMLKPRRALLGRPISICEKSDGIISFLYAVVGTGTEEFRELEKDDYIDVIGPLGNGFDEKKDYGRVALVAGGIGIAPMLQLAKVIKENGNSKVLDLYAGFRDETYLLEELQDFTDSISIATDKGTFGHKGFVTDIIDYSNYDTILCCGPEVMMKKVIDKSKENKINIYASMEKHMACGVGACLVCTCKTKEGNKRTCKDGPVFNGYDLEL